MGRSAHKDSSSKSCLIGIFDRIYSKGVPTSLNRASLALKVAGEPNEKAQLKIEIVRPTGGVLATIEAELQLGEKGATEVHTAIQGMPLPDWGVYGFNIYLGEVLSPKTITITVGQPLVPKP